MTLIALPIALAPTEAEAAPVVAGILVQTIATSLFGPGSPDPAGIAYLPGVDRFVAADSEVEETTGAGWHGANLWRFTNAGAVQDTGDTTSYTKEPTGLGFDPATERMFVSSDNGEKVFILRSGSDGRYGTSDDVRSVLLAAGFGSIDAEDVAFDTRNGHLYIADGTNVEVIDVDPVNGTFGDGDDTSTHFDMARYGSRDTEGIGYDAARDTLVVADRSTRQLYEVTPQGELVRTIDIRGVSGIRNPSDVEIAPSSTGAGRTYWVVDREVDNGVDPNENDGRLFEISVPSAIDAPPSVTLTSPPEGASVGGTVTLSANATDDHGVATVDFLVDATVVATDASGADGWTASWSSVAVGDGVHTVTARATDTIGQIASDASSITVDNDPSTASVDVRIVASNDDAEQKANTNVVLDSDDLDLMLDGTVTISHVGLRFAEVPVPAGATITDAYVRFTSDEIHTGSTTLTISGQAAGDPDAFVAVKRDISARTLTGASVTWPDIPAWTAKDVAGSAQLTPQLAPVIQEIVGRGDWASGNAIVLIVTGSGQRVARAADHRSVTGPLLHIEYDLP